MNKLVKYYSWQLLLLALLEVLLFAKNYTPGTFFIGWDNLFPEMNFTANLSRSFFAVWQEYRGLGLLDGMSFAANLPHYIFLFLLSFVLPIDLLRYFFIFLMHFLGGVGIYFLVLELSGHRSEHKWVALLSALFYLLNIGTIQMFYIPYEVFTVHFAFLPILILFLIKFLKSGAKKHLLYLFLISILAIPQAHVPTLFIVFLIAFGSILFFHYIFTSKKGLKRIVATLVFIIAVNSFWGLPFVYSTLTNAQAISNSKINQMSTEDIYLKNKAYGDLLNVVLLKGFSLDTVNNQTQPAKYVMEVWRNHTKQPFFIIPALILFAFGLLGLAEAIRSREKRFYPFILMFVFALLMLADDTPILSFFSSFLRTYIPFFDQVFRFTYTKFIILFSFSLAVLISLGFLTFSQLTIFKKPLIKLTFLLVVFTAYSMPVWQGNFLYAQQRLNIPQQYFQTVDFFQKVDKNTRIALLPQTSLWGWSYNSWGYQGSGFIWYGIQQASLDGAFYPWSSQNENYYWQLSQAFFQKNKVLFESILNKYQIGWLIVDKSLKSPFSTKIDYQDQIQSVIENSSQLKQAAEFGDIAIYKVNLKVNMQNFTFLGQNLPNINPPYKWNNLDQAYLDFGDYISTPKLNVEGFTSYYPFRSLFTARNQKELEFEVKDQGDYFSFEAKVPANLSDSKLVMQPQDSQEVKVTAVDFDNNLIKVKVPKIKVAEIQPADMQISPQVCNEFNKGIYQLNLLQQGTVNFLRMHSIGSDNCLTIGLPDLNQQAGYLTTVESRYQSGKSLLFSIINQASQRADLEVNLPQSRTPTVSYFVIPPVEQTEKGYTFYFDNISYGRVKTTNYLGKITVNLFPYQFLKSLKLVKEINFQPIDSGTNIMTTHPNPSLYSVRTSRVDTETTNQVLVLSQSFSAGWKAYQVNSQNPLTLAFPFLFGQEIKQHLLVNNWENGWIIKNSPLVIVYLPQYLQYLGFAILIVSFFVLLTKKDRYD